MRAGCAQLEAKSMSRAGEVWGPVERLAHAAAAQGVELLVYPEITYPSYWFETPERYWQADIERMGAVLKRYGRLAAAHSMWVVAGYVEEAGDRLFNSAAVFDRSGRLIGSARKQFLWDCDHRWFSPGEASSVFETEWGPMGLLICADLRLPEITATLAARGATFVVQPTAWVNASREPGDYRNIQPEFLVRARAIESGLPFICCSKSGGEGGVMEYVGQSRLVAADGGLLATAAIEGDELVVADINPGTPNRSDRNPNWRARVLSGAPAFEPNGSSPRCVVELRRGAAGILRSLENSGVRARLLTGDHLVEFGCVRAMALDGVQAVVVPGKMVDECHLRARAAENRIFLIAADEEAALLIIDPAGGIAWRRGDLRVEVELDLAQADRKYFTPTTPIWSQRRVDAYQL